MLNNRGKKEFFNPKLKGTALAVLSVMATNSVMAQEAKKPADTKEQADHVVVVSGTRKSVASAIDRKLRADTVADSIVAEDIGQFPDKNVGEALSRVTGVQLERSFGEGTSVSIRGVEPDLNRIEINGVSILSTTGTAGRGADLRELPAELISSIDVIKGVTANMTEGGIGGSVQISTRKPLDFKKMTVVGSVAGEQAPQRGGVQPRVNLFITDKFFDDRLGLMANVIYDKVLTRGDFSRNTSWRYFRDWDFSPQKTVPSIDPVLAGVGSKADCSNLSSPANATQTAAAATAALQASCVSQWNDYSPQIARYGIWERDHERTSAELTAQYKFTDRLNAWVSYQTNIQNQKLRDYNYGTDFSAVTRLSSTGTLPTYAATTAVPTGGSCTPVSTTTTPAGMIVENHIVTQYVLGNCLVPGSAASPNGGQAGFSTSLRDFGLKIDSKYTTAGFTYKGERLDVEGLASSAKSTYSSDSNNLILTQNAPGLQVNLDSSGLPRFTFPTGYSPSNPNSYISAQLQYRPSETINKEDQLKLDFKYKLKTDFLSRIWFGVQSQQAKSSQYNGGGYLASAGNDLSSTADDVYVQTANINQTYSYDPLNTTNVVRATVGPTNLADANAWTRSVNSSAMAALAQSVFSTSPGTFFKGYSGISNVPTNWVAPSFANVGSNFDLTHFNHDYLYNAPGSDGKMYAQIPAYVVDEKVKSVYLRADFDTELFGKDIFGNIGVRYTQTRDVSQGLFKQQINVEKTPGSTTFNTVILSNSITSIDNTYSNVLPSFNAGAWLIPNQFLVRVGWGKVMARPRILDIVPNATCTKNSGAAQFGGDGTDDCTAGNPALKPFQASNTDLSLEYYPNADSQLSLAVFRKNITVGNSVSTNVKNVDLFKDGTLWDVKMPINYPGAVTRGIELAGRTALTFLPGFFSGFGIDANYTRMNFTYAPGTERLNPLDNSILPYAGLSKNAYNLGLWYDKDKFNARLAYHYRDRYYTGTNDVSGNPNFIEKTGYLDAKFQYRYSPNITISFEGKNLTDQANITDAGDLSRPNELAWSGRRYFIGVSIKN